jgi:taurine dioxygenase
MIISNIQENGEPIGIVEAGQYWHSDASYSPKPPAYACLHAKEIPHAADGSPLGGTMFVSTSHAYDTLPTDIKDRLAGMRVLHSRDHRQFSALRTKSKNEYDAPGQELDQPVVRTHPVTGKKCLYVNQTYAVRLLGVSDSESEELLRYLIGHIIREEVRYTHRWAVGDLVIWDDCAVQHHAIGDYGLPQRRLVYRTVVDGTRPT